MEKAKRHSLDEGPAGWRKEKRIQTTFLNWRNRQIKKSFQSLQIEGVTTDNPEIIIKEINVFYQSLYKTEFSKADCSIFFDKLKEFRVKLDEGFNKTMEEDLKIEELGEALNKMSPGIDGLTIDLCIFFWMDIGKLLYSALLECISLQQLSVP